MGYSIVGREVVKKKQKKKKRIQFVQVSLGARAPTPCNYHFGITRYREKKKKIDKMREYVNLLWFDWRLYTWGIAAVLIDATTPSSYFKYARDNARTGKSI